MEVLNDDVLLTIILHTSLYDLMKLYNTNQRLRRLLDAPVTLQQLSTKHDVFYTKNMTFKNVLNVYSMQLCLSQCQTISRKREASNVRLRRCSDEPW